MSPQPVPSNRFRRVKNVFSGTSRATTSLVKDGAASPREDTIQSSRTPSVRPLLGGLTSTQEPLMESVTSPEGLSSTPDLPASSKTSAALTEDPLLPKVDDSVKPFERSLSGPFVKGALAALRGILNDMNLPGASACQLIIKAVETYEVRFLVGKPYYF